MNFASKVLSRELYELTNWETGRCWEMRIPVIGHEPDKYTPEYDLGFLLRKLPPGTAIYSHDGLGTSKGMYSTFILYQGKGIKEHKCSADTPEDALCLFAIELFKAGILQRGDNAV